jgi:hypothetical protein
MTIAKDYATYENIRLEIEHHYMASAQELAILLFRDSQDTVMKHQHGMTVYHLDGQKYMTMKGPGGSKKITEDYTWCWRLIELRHGSNDGPPLITNFDSFEEKFMAPIAFVDHMVDDADDQLTFTIFRPTDRKHYPLTSVGVDLREEFSKLLYATGKALDVREKIDTLH